VTGIGRQEQRAEQQQSRQLASNDQDPVLESESPAAPALRLLRERQDAWVKAMDASAEPLKTWTDSVTDEEKLEMARADLAYFQCLAELLRARLAGNVTFSIDEIVTRVGDRLAGRRVGKGGLEPPRPHRPRAEEVARAVACASSMLSGGSAVPQVFGDGGQEQLQVKEQPMPVAPVATAADRAAHLAAVAQRLKAEAAAVMGASNDFEVPEEDPVRRLAILRAQQAADDAAAQATEAALEAQAAAAAAQAVIAASFDRRSKEGPAPPDESLPNRMSELSKRGFRSVSGAPVNGAVAASVQKVGNHRDGVPASADGQSLKASAAPKSWEMGPRRKRRLARQEARRRAKDAGLPPEAFGLGPAQAKRPLPRPKPKVKVEDMELGLSDESSGA